MPLKWLLLHRATSARNGQQTDGASTAVSVGSSTALNAYLATRRAEVDRLRTEPAPLRVHAIEDTHRRATLDAAAAPTMLSPADGASADGTLGATKSAIGQALTKPYRKDVSLLLDSEAVAGPLVTRARQRVVDRRKHRTRAPWSLVLPVACGRAALEAVGVVHEHNFGN